MIYKRYYDGTGNGYGEGGGSGLGLGSGTGVRQAHGGGDGTADRAGEGSGDWVGLGDGYSDRAGIGDGYDDEIVHRFGAGVWIWEKLGFKNPDRKGDRMQYLIYRDGITEASEVPIKVSRTRAGHTIERYVVDGEKRYFVTLAGSHYCAHGNTIAEAVASAIWKDPAKRPSLEKLKKEINDAGPGRKITLQEFRVLTGACEYGCKQALKQAGLSGQPMTPKQIQKYFPDWGSKLLSILEAE